MPKVSFVVALVTMIVLACSSQKAESQLIEQRYFLMTLGASELEPYERFAVHRACNPDVPYFVRQETFMMYGIRIIPLASDIRCVPRQGHHIVAIECDHTARHRGCTITTLHDLSFHLELLLRNPQFIGIEIPPIKGQ